MAIPSKQIGWGTESNLLWQIAKQIQYLTQVTGTSLSSLISQTITCGVTDKAPSEDAVCQALALKQDILGKISLSDPNNTFFSDLISARAYVQAYTSAIITNESYDSTTKTYCFTVPPASEFNLQDYFCNSSIMNFQDPYGLVVSFGTGGFTYNETDNIFGNVTAGNEFLQYSSGNNVMGDVTANYDFLAYSTGNNTIGDVDTQGSKSFLSNSSGSNTIGNVITAESFLQGSSGNNIMGDVTAGENFLYESLGNNIIGNVTTANYFLQGSSGNNIIGDVITNGKNFLQLSTGNNTIGNVTTNESFLQLSTGNNTMGNVTAGDIFLTESSGNNVIGDVNATNNFLEGSTGNNTMNTINVGDDAFAGATPTIKNSIYKIDTCGIGFAVNYKGRIDIGLWGSDGDQNLPSDIFITTNLTWIHTFYSNRFNFTGGPDRDIVQALANMSNVNSIVIYE
jgi:hypothetical protein